MSDSQQAASPYTDAQLHALACIRCGRENGELLAAGHVKTPSWPGEHLTWAVAACPNCLPWDAPC